MSKKRIMILGAGINQLPAIKKAVDLGFFVITVDYLPDNIGHKYSDKYINCSTLDKEGVLSAAKELEVDGIVTFGSDVATLTVGFVTEKLGLSGYNLTIASTLSNKASFREFQRMHKLNRPDFIIGKDFSAIEKQISGLHTPLIFKPIDTSGSRGISRIDWIENKKCVQAFEYAQSFSRSKTVCVEEFVDGIEVGGDAFLQDSKIKFIVITHKHMNGPIVLGHSLPTNISKTEQKKVHSEIEKTCISAGYKNGPLNFDVIVSKKCATILEMSPRLGGNGIPMVIEHGTAADLIKASLQHALGMNVELNNDYICSHPCGSYVFGSRYPGILKSIASKNAIEENVSEVFEYIVNYNNGEEIPEFIHNGNSLGYVLFECPKTSSYEDIVSRFFKSLKLQVELLD